jgi:hypothetical protein
MASYRKAWVALALIIVTVTPGDGISASVAKSLTSFRPSQRHSMLGDSDLRKLRKKSQAVLNNGEAKKLDDSDEEILTTLGIAFRAVWLGMVWTIPVFFAPVAMLLKPFRVSVWYNLLALALSNSGAIDTRIEKACGWTFQVPFLHKMQRKKKRASLQKHIHVQ